jgi:hypothetical protein
VEFKRPPDDGMAGLGLPGDWLAILILALVAVVLAAILLRRLGRDAGAPDVPVGKRRRSRRPARTPPPGGALDSPVLNSGQCGWSRTGKRTSLTTRWVCGRCGADAHTTDGEPPRTCHSGARPRPL